LLALAEFEGSSTATGTHYNQNKKHCLGPHLDLCLPVREILRVVSMG